MAQTTHHKLHDDTAMSATMSGQISEQPLPQADMQAGVQSASRVLSRHRTSLSLVLFAVAMVALTIVEGLMLRSNTADHAAEMRIILAAGARWAAFVPAAHAIAVCFSAMVAVPVIAILLGVIWAVTRSVGQMLRGLAMAALPMAVIGLIKTIIDRPRPSTARGVLMPDPSFPSGHTACSVVVVSLALFMLQVIDARIRGSRRLAGLSAGDSHTPAIAADSAIPQSPVVWRGVRAVLTVVLIIVPFVVAFSRVVYGVHYPTDVGTSLVLTPVLTWCVYRLCEPMR